MTNCCKKKFSRIDCLLIIARSKISKSKKRKEQNYYFCNYCNSYHLTSRNKNG